MDRLSSVLPKVLKKRGLQPLADASSVVLRAIEWIGHHLPRHAGTIKPVKFQDGNLVIEADNPIALSELSRMSGLLAEHLRAELPSIRILGVRCMRARRLAQP